MVTLDTLEGMINGSVSYHYDAAADVLYLRRAGTLDAAALGEETDEGLIQLRDETTGELVGLTVVSWWKRFGQGPFPDSLREIEQRIEPWAQRAA